MPWDNAPPEKSITKPGFPIKNIYVREPYDYVGDAGQHCFCIDNELGYKCAKKDKGKWKGTLTAVCNSEDLAAAKANEKVVKALGKNWSDAMELTEELYQLIKVNICSREWLFQRGALLWRLEIPEMLREEVKMATYFLSVMQQFYSTVYFGIEK